MLKLTVFENGKLELPRGQASESAKLRLLATVVGGRSAFVARNGQVFARDCVGAIEVGHIRVEVLPKAFGVQSIEEARGLLYNFLRYAFEDARIAWLPGGGAERGSDILEVVEQNAARELFARLEASLPRRYAVHEETSLVLRGGVRLSKYAQQLPTKAHLVPVRYNILTADGDLGRVLKALARFLRSRSQSYNARKELDQCLDLLRDVTDCDLTPELVQKTARLNRQETHWRRLLDLARILATSKVPDPTRSGETFQPTMLFTLNRLFELVVRRTLTEHLHAPLTCDRTPSAISLLKSGISNVLSITPDLLFRVGLDVRAVGDVKWKRLSAEKERYGVTPDDIYQLLTYMRRFATVRGLLLYPRTDWMASEFAPNFSVEHTQGESIQLVPVDIAGLVSGDREAARVSRENLVGRVTSILHTQ